MEILQRRYFYDLNSEHSVHSGMRDSFGFPHIMQICHLFLNPDGVGLRS